MSGFLFLSIVCFGYAGWRQFVGIHSSPFMDEHPRDCEPRTHRAARPVVTPCRAGENFDCEGER